jgi:hypothetical protein
MSSIATKKELNEKSRFDHESHEEHEVYQQRNPIPLRGLRALRGDRNEGDSTMLTTGKPETPLI